MWSPPAWKRDVQQEYLDKHIEGAVKFDIAEFSDKTSSTPLMILPQQQFEEKVGKVILLCCYDVICKSIYKWASYYNVIST